MTNPRQEALILVSLDDIELLEESLQSRSVLDIIAYSDDLLETEALINSWRRQLESASGEPA